MTSASDPGRIAEAFAAALETPASERDALLRQLLPDDDSRAEVYRLLVRHDSLEASGSSFLEALDSVVAAEMLEVGQRPPATIGRYEVQRELARGGHGVVYLARDPELDRHVAIKVLPSERERSPDARERLRAEARIISALDHPHIATIFEIDRTARGDLFVVMGYYAGDTLRTRLAAGAMPVEEALRVAVQVADALAAAHAKGIVHRDVKPENVILTTSGARLLDFGIAVTVAGTEEAAPAGTVAYMSPEQSHGASAAPSADLWALGVVLYEMLAGRRPFDGQRSDVLLDVIRHGEPPPLRALRPELPLDLVQLVEECLEKDPARRPHGADVVRRRLLALGQRRRRPAGVLAGVALGVLALVVATRSLGGGSGAAKRPAGGTTDLVAESLYVRGMALMERRTPADLEEAAVAFRTAIGRDPSFARPYAALARVAAQSQGARPSDVFSRTQPLLQRAASLDETNADVQLELGWAAMWYDRDWLAAERYLRRALALDQNDPWKYHYYAAWLSAIGRLDEAVALERRAMVVDPRGAATATHVALHLTRQERYGEAIEMLERVLQVDTTWARAYLVLGRAYLGQGRYDDALRMLRRGNYRFAGFDPEAILAYGLGVAGRTEEARRLTAAFERRARDGYTNPVNLIACYLGLGDMPRALDWAERLTAERGVMFFPRSDPMFAPMLGEPRFRVVLQRLGLDSASVARLPDTRAAIAAILRGDGPRTANPPAQGS